MSHRWACRFLARLWRGAGCAAAAAALLLGGGAQAGSGRPLMEPGRPHFRAQLVRHGLPQSTVMSLAFDQRGALWVGTQDGAGWYDGTRWTTVDMPERQVSNYVECVLPASDGSVWFGRGDGGIAQFKPDGSWASFGAESLPALRVTSLAEVPGPDGRPVIWAGTYGGGLVRYQDGRWSPPEGRRNWPHPRIWKLVPSEQPGEEGALWVCGEGGTLVRLRPSGAFESFPGLPSVSVNHLLESRDGRGEVELYASTFGRGIACLRKGRWSFLTTRDGLPSDFTTDVAETRTPWGTRVLWFASVGGLTRLEGGRLRTFTARSGLGSDAIYRLRQDPQRADALWIGTLGGGLLHHREGGWLVHDALSGLPGNYVLSLAEGLPAGGRPTVLAGTSIGIARYQGGTWTDIPLPPGHASTRINALLESRRSGKPVLWVGTLAGLLRLESGRWTVFDGASGLPSQAIGVLLEGRNAAGRDVLWVGTQTGGLAAWDGARWTVQDLRTGLPSNGILALAEQPEAGPHPALWAGFRNGGLGCWRAGKWTFWNRANGLPNDSVSAILFTRSPTGRPRILAGTLGGGLVWAWLDQPVLQWNVLSSRSVPPALPNDVIHALLEDDRGRVYLGTNRGVCRLTPRGETDFELSQFVEKDGLPGLQCSPNGALAGSDGRVWVGTTVGLAELEPQVEPAQARPGRIALLKVRIGGQLVLPLPLARGLLRHPEKDLDLAFSLIDPHGGAGVKYRTQLVGAEPSPGPWEATGLREFTNLAQGTYVFKVWARDGLGREVGPLAWPLDVQPAPWETLWFRGAVAGVLALLAFLVLRWRLRHVHRRAEQLEMLVSQRTEDLARTNLRLTAEVAERLAAEKVKDEFVSVVSHELRTPLTSIRGALGLLEGGVLGQLGGQATELVRIAHANALRLMALVNDLLDIQRMEADHVHLQQERAELRGLLERMREAHGGLAQSFGVGFELDLPADPTEAWIDVRRIEQVIGNLLANACKFSRRGSAVKVRLVRHGGSARISVTNHGPAIPEEFRPRIFSKFAQADASSSRPAGGTGLGLAISKALVEAHGGRIGFDSDETATTFWFELPLEPPGGDDAEATAGA